jgi:hypothetical protein
VAANPNISSRQIEDNVGISKRTSIRILKKYKYKPYKVRLNHYLCPCDGDRRLQFCRWYIAKCDSDPNFKNKMIWSDEARIQSDGIFNRNNCHQWSDVNPHATWPVRHQSRFGFNVIAVIWASRFHYIFYDGNLNSVRYVQLLNDLLADILDDIPLNNRLSTWFQLDVAPAHNAQITKHILKQKFHNRWVGKAGPVKWPSDLPT